ncbi:hypothetical protein DIPPA_26591 [Diplonema papillatum]|nr:hypothetical protein DIPPA_26591 [Diplonema papillatum]|eukprot:gene16690-25614_t
MLSLADGTLLARVPFAFITNVAMCVLLLIEVQMSVPGENTFVATTVDKIGTIFSPDWTTEADPTVSFYTSEDVYNFIADSYTGWFALQDDKLAVWFTDGAPEMTVRYLQKPWTFEDVARDITFEPPMDQLTCTIDGDNPVGPFNASRDGNDSCAGVDDLLKRIDRATYRFSVRSLRTRGEMGTPVCYNWDVTQTYKFTHTGVVLLDILMDDSLCDLDAWDRGFGTPLDNVRLLLLLFTLGSLALRGRVLWRKFMFRRMLAASSIGSDTGHSLHTLRKSSLLRPKVVLGGSAGTTVNVVQEEVRSDESESSNLSAASSLSRIEFYQDALNNVTMQMQDLEIKKKTSWVTIGLVADFITLASCLCNLILYRALTSASSSTLTIARSLVGFACFFEYIACVGHLGEQPWLYLLINSLKRGMPLAMRFIVGCLPLYFGYVCFGTIVFGRYTHRFVTFDAGCVTLFSVLNGDVMHDIFEDIYPEQGGGLKFLSRIYMYSFIILFIYAILNTFLAIMEDTYFQIKQALVADLQEDMREAEGDL